MKVNESSKTEKFKDPTDPQYVGPGTWNVIHRLAFCANTKDKQKIFIYDMREICKGFPCKNCVQHCSKYIEDNPLEVCIGVVTEMNGEKKQLGMFIWTWKFHNIVNARLNKPYMTWDTAYNMYSHENSLVCSQECLNSN